jgi:hypothetical protein
MNTNAVHRKQDDKQKKNQFICENWGPCGVSVGAVIQK